MRKPARMEPKGRRTHRRLSSPFQIWNIQNWRSYEASARRIQGAGIRMQLMSSSPGIVLSHGWHLTKLSFCIIGFTWRNAALLREPSTSALQPCAGSLTKQPTQSVEP